MSYGGFDKYVESYKFPYNNIEQLVDVDEKPIGLIYDLDYKPKPPEPFPRNLLPKIGLKNIGATCYMNATLRSLAQIEQLVYYFKDVQNTQIINSSIAKCKQNNKKSLTESFKILIDNLWPEFYNGNLKKNNNNYHYSPYDFKSKISSMNPLFEGVQANDAKDLVNFIIMTLHEELNTKQKQNLGNNNQVTVLLATMAGKGTEVGTNIQELKKIIDGIKDQSHIGVCLDTCHLNDAGYDLNDFDRYLDEFDQEIGIEKIGCIHINDSKNEKSSHKDRHENIGFGTIGFDTLISIIYNERLKNIPRILETPYVDRLYPPYQEEIEMIRKKEFNKDLINIIKNKAKNT